MSHLFQAKLIDINTSLIHFVNLVKGIITTFFLYHLYVWPVHPGVDSGVSWRTSIAIADNPNLGEGVGISFIGGGNKQGASFIQIQGTVKKLHHVKYFVQPESPWQLSTPDLPAQSFVWKFSNTSASHVPSIIHPRKLGTVTSTSASFRWQLRTLVSAASPSFGSFIIYMFRVGLCQ